MIDIVVLIVGTIMATGIAFLNLGVGVAVGFVVVHFFLFCNVLRMSRPLELTWAVAFILLSALCVSVELISWLIVFGVSVLLTLVLARIEMKRPSYHGVGWKRINPRLPTWWADCSTRGRDHSPGAPVGTPTGEG